MQIADLEEKLELAASCKDAELQDERLRAFHVSILCAVYFKMPELLMPHLLIAPGIPLERHANRRFAYGASILAWDSKRHQLIAGFPS